jgi:NADH:ubiquinone oxidoreductase subunit 5 (subunit L)/multisubunit Na+/H+ antiporter MnhA subunit
MERLPTLLLIAWLLPLASFTLICVGYSLPQMLGMRVRYSTQRYAGYIAIAAIAGGFLVSIYSLFGVWLPEHPLVAPEHHEEKQPDPVAADTLPSATAGLSSSASDGQALVSPVANPFRFAALQETHTEEGEAHATNGPPHYEAGDWYTLAQFGNLKLTIGYYIDTLTIVMFCMVTLIASCIHIYATGYMHDELHDVTDHEVTMAGGGHLHRRGRFHRFFQYFSLFSFSMLGICISGNLVMTFVFWELVGICSYFLIGFYFERHSASTAANKAFIVNRVGDFGMLIGLMAIWTSLGTFSFGDVETTGADGNPVTEPGIFSLLHTEENRYELAPADGMIALEARGEVADVVRGGGGEAEVAARMNELRADEDAHWGYWTLVIAGVGIFCGCMGKSAQFPLHVWLPDAMEGPTPVSALVHSATMVAAGVFLVGRVYPIFTPEALLVIAVIGCITLFLAATIAITAVDIKRVLAYSTVSQLGFMMLALGLGGWVAGLFHLITHAFFKSLLFLCSGSVIHAVHTNDMRQMGGLRHKMPITAYTMLIGCLAIAGIGIPFWLGFSGFHSKDLIVEQAINFAFNNEGHWYTWVFVVVPLAGALMTSFYMFRLWYMTFAGRPRDHHRYDHAHESPWVMAGPLVLLAVFAVGVGWTLPARMPGVLANLGVESLLDEARPVGQLGNKTGVLLPGLVVPDEHASHEPIVRTPAGWSAIGVAIAGIAGASIVYLWELINAATLRRYLNALYHLTWNKWWFDELYDYVFVRPTHAVSRFIAQVLDRGLIDSIIHACAYTYRGLSSVVAFVGDRLIIDNTVDTFAEKTWDLGLSLRSVQTGRLRQYVMFIVAGTMALFVVATVWWYVAVMGR